MCGYFMILEKSDDQDFTQILNFSYNIEQISYLTHGNLTFYLMEIFVSVLYYSKTKQTKNKTENKEILRIVLMP